jgi:predicted RND superfamily exporter protein
VNTSRLFGAMASAATARPRLVVALALAVGLLGGVLALGLSPSGAADTFVGRSSAAYRDTQTFYRQFGEEPVEVLVQGNLQQLLESADLARLLGLEGCLSGRVPAAALAAEGGTNGPCGRLDRADAVKVVLGPATFVNEAAREIDEQLGRQQHHSETQAAAARRAVREQALARGLSQAEALSLGNQARKATLSAYAAEVAALAVQYGLTSEPALNNAQFVNALVFAHSAPAGTPKSRFAYLFPSADSALVSVRLRAGLSEQQRTAAIALIRSAVAMPQWDLEHGEHYLVTGEPVIVSDLTGSLAGSIELLLVVVALVMAVVLGLIFVASPSLLPLLVAILACAVTFGALALVGGSLTLGSLAVLPVLVGLAVDYAVQLQSRTEEALAAGVGATAGAEPAPGASADAAAVRQAVGVAAPTIAVAALASAGAMLGLLVSPVPLVRGFAELLMVGIVVAFVCALTAGSAGAVLWRSRGRPAPRSALGWGLGARLGGRLPRGAWAQVGASWRGARELARENPVPGLVRGWALTAALRRPGTVVAAGVVLAVVGWAVTAQTPVQTELTKLVPGSLGSLQSLNVLERDTGSGGQIDLLLEGANLATPAAVRWMTEYQGDVLHRFGYSAASSGSGSASASASATTAATGPACANATLCPAFSLSDLFSGSVSGGSQGTVAHLGRGEIDSLLAVIPPYFAQNVITPNRHYATLAFGIRLMALSRQQRVIESMRSLLHPPPGVRAHLVGLAVLAAAADGDVSSPSGRMFALLISLVVVVIVLAVAFGGDARRTIAAAAPVVLASGWSGLLLYGTGVTLNPMSVTLSCLVVAIATELSVLLSERYRQERLAGRRPPEALQAAYRSTGAAVAVSAVTAIAGFAVLTVSEVRMLQEFGLVTVLDLAVSLVGVLLALPSVLLVAERAGRRDSAAAAPAPAAARALGAAFRRPRSGRRGGAADPTTPVEP